MIAKSGGVGLLRRTIADRQFSEADSIRLGAWQRTRGPARRPQEGGRARHTLPGLLSVVWHAGRPRYVRRAARAPTKTWTSQVEQRPPV